MTLRCDPECLPPLGTLRRIRWSFQPRSRDSFTAFGDAQTAEWHSRATLSLRRFSPVLPVRSTRDFLSLDVPADGFTRQLLLRARSLFTQPCRSFWSAFAVLIRDQLSPNDFCNFTSTCGQPNRSSHDPRRDEGLDLLPFLFLLITPSPLLGR